MNFGCVGMGLTVFALFRGVTAFRSGDQQKSQQMMRMRVAAQGFTLVAALVGMFMYSEKYNKVRHPLNAPERTSAGVKTDDQSNSS
jgi:hypothetical protein